MISHPRAHQRLATVFALTATVALAACSSGQEGPAGSKKPAEDGVVRIAYLQKQGDQQYFVDQANGARALAGKLGAELIIVNLGDDANKAIGEIDAAIALGVDAIAIVVPDQKIGPQVIDRAKQAGIALVASDDVITDAGGVAAPFVGFDGAAMGTEVGKKAGELYKTAGWSPADTRILRVSKEDLSVCEDRVNAAGAAFTAAAGVTPTIIKVGSDATVIDTQNKTAAIITANPGVKHWVVYGCNDESVTGAVTALQNADVTADNIIGIGLGAYLACKDWKVDKNTGNKAALYISGTDVGQAAVQALYDKVANNKPLPARTIAKTYMVDATNWKAVGMTCT